MKREVVEQHQGPGGELVYSGDDNELFLMVNFFDTGCPIMIDHMF